MTEPRDAESKRSDFSVQSTKLLTLWASADRKFPASGTKGERPSCWRRFRISWPVAEESIFSLILLQACCQENSQEAISYSFTLEQDHRWFRPALRLSPPFQDHGAPARQTRDSKVNLRDCVVRMNTITPNADPAASKVACTQLIGIRSFESTVPLDFSVVTGDDVVECISRVVGSSF